jgi:hypothetical protein
MQYFIVNSAGNGSEAVNFATDDEGARGMTRGDRVLLYQVRGEADAERILFTAWGEVDRLGHEGDEATAHLKAVSSLKRPVSSTELRSDPRRSREAGIQPVTADVFNGVIARSRR